VFRKFPDVTVALSEGGIGWIPYFLERLDHSYRTHKAWTGADFGTKMPSEVFMEHVMLCYINDGVGVKLARDIGVDRITVEIDYPHSDANWPTAPERMMEEFDATDLTDAEIDAITHENAMRFFRYDPFSIRPRERCTVGALRAEADGWDVSPRSTAILEHEHRDGPVKITDLTPTA
jgi:predicted TIM-barrel fold metal-dependent hydrolase